MGMFLGMQGATTAVTVMFQSYFKNVALSGVVSAFAMIPILIFTPLARKLVVKYGKKELATLGAVCSVVACALMLVLRILHLILRSRRVKITTHSMAPRVQYVVNLSQQNIPES
jgi:Na+/melibiose symporter-like transporter